MTDGLTTPELYRLVNRYIGVTDGYLGDFTYRTHREFYPEYCGLDIDPTGLSGTTRERFVAIVSQLAPEDQARVIRGVLERFPVGSSPAPETRTEALRVEFEALAGRLTGGVLVGAERLKETSVVVMRALTDAEELIHSTGATSGVDRVHTALHGHLIVICESAGVTPPSGATITQLLRLLRQQHPRLAPTGPRAEDVGRVLNGLGSVLDALQPVRNMASLAHPNRDLLDPAEAMLVINATRTILSYLDAKLM